MERNITLSKVIFSLHSAWFWLGIWVPYYLLFTNYSGIGIIETVVVLSAFLLELPTGAFTDLVGKKKSLFLVFLFFVLGDVVMAFASEYWHLLASVLLLGIGTSLYSGTRDAFLYDSLLSLKKEEKYETLLAAIQKYSLIIMAAASAIGGLLYTSNPSLPFLAVAAVHFVCGALVLFLKEPAFDTEKFSWTAYIHQMKGGVRQLFSHSEELSWIWKLLIVSAFIKYLIEGIDPSLALHYGMNEVQLGYLYAVIPLVSAAGAFWYEKRSGNHTRNFWWKLLLGTFFITAVVSPIFGFGLGILGLLLRNIFYPILETLSSNTINRNVSSKYRATTLSAFAMISSLPYVIGAAFVGRVIDLTNSALVTAGLAVIFFAFYLVQKFSFSHRARSRV